MDSVLALDFLVTEEQEQQESHILEVAIYLFTCLVPLARLPDTGINRGFERMEDVQNSAVAP